jgi:hypothetical protein
MANIQISQLADAGALQDVDQIPIVRGNSNYKITGDKIATNSALDDVKNNLIFNSEFYNTREDLGTTPQTTRQFICDYIVGARGNSTSPWFGYQYRNAEGEKVLRWGVPDADTATNVGGYIVLYIPQYIMTSLKGKTIHFSCKIYFGKNYNTKTRGAALRLRAGGTFTPNQIGDINGDLQKKQDLGSTGFLGNIFSISEQVREEWIDVEVTFTVPLLTSASAEYYEGMLFFDQIINASGELPSNTLLPVDKKSIDPLADDEFYFEMKEPQITIGTEKLSYRGTGYVESNATNTILTTQQEYFDKNNAKAITSENIANDVRQASFSIINKSYNGVQQTDAGDSATWLPIAAPQLIPTGDETLDGTGIFVSGLNLLGTMLSANEANTDLVDYTGFQFKDTANALLNVNGKWFNDTDKKWLAPSPLNTFNQGSNRKLFFRIRIPEFVITTENSFNGNAMYLYVRLLRYNFNAQNRKIISQIPIVLSEINNTANIPYTFLYSTNIKGEADPFVSAGNGFYMDIIKSDKSSAGGGNSAYLRHVRIDIERN